MRSLLAASWRMSGRRQPSAASDGRSETRFEDMAVQGIDADERRSSSAGSNKSLGTHRMSTVPSFSSSFCENDPILPPLAFYCSCSCPPAPLAVPPPSPDLTPLHLLVLMYSLALQSPRERRGAKNGRS
eukprot:752971-Hanusia_phi.AAC.2